MFDPSQMTYGELERRVIETDLCLGCSHEQVCELRRAVARVQGDRPWHIAIGSCAHYRKDEDAERGGD